VFIWEKVWLVQGADKTCYKGFVITENIMKRPVCKIRRYCRWQTVVSLDISILHAHYADKFAFLKIYLKILIAQTVYTGCARINYKTVPVTNFNI